MNVAKILELSNFVWVSVSVKVVDEKDVVDVHKGLMKQEYVIAEVTGCTKIMKWNADVGCLAVKVTYFYGHYND